MPNFKQKIQSHFKFCPRCGKKFVFKKIHGRAELFCRNCQFIFWQNSKPTASGFLSKGRQVLLVRRRVKPLKGFWDAPGGFLDFHESAEKGLARELREELGIQIRQPRFLGIYLGEYFSDLPQSTFNLYFLIKNWSGQLKPADDISACAWFKLNELPKKIAFANNQRALRDLKKLLG